ncbi:MAG: hypothetical protein F6K62_16510 [Sphaerospermopsis sp. SIO1G2]|nr:hypothetical protein [Sphaerospermopsis sp. SIO1G2]
MGDIWIKQKNIDEDFKQLISTPSVASNFTIDTHFKLIEIQWELIAILKNEVNQSPNNQEILNKVWSNAPNPTQSSANSQIDSSTLNYPIINSFQKPDLSDDQKIKLTQTAKEIVKKYIHPQQLKILLDDCQSWGLSQLQRIEIIKASKPETYTISLLYPDLRYSDLAEHQQLLAQFWQLKPKNQPEQDNYKEMLNQSLMNQIKNSGDISIIRSLQEIAHPELFTEALDDVVKSLITTEDLLKLINLCIELKLWGDINKIVKESIMSNLEITL